MKEKCIFCWSGGKDSALALYKIMKDEQYEVVALLTTLNARFKRVSMHGIREELLDKQVASIGIPLIKMYVDTRTNAEYEKEMESVLLSYKERGVTKIIFGDIFLEDLRQYREKNLDKVGLKAIFPLWKQDTKKLIREFLDLGFKTITCCVNDAYLDKDKAGVEVNKIFIEELPGNVDACGENGEYHTFCYGGPLYKYEILFTIGEKVYKPIEAETVQKNKDGTQTKGFWFCDLI